MTRLPPPVLALTPGTLAEGDERGRRELRARVDAAREGGLAGVLLREPELPDAELLALARDLRERLGEAGWLGVHDRAHVALAARADGVHLGFRSPAPRDLRPWLAERASVAALAVGLSTHAGDDPGCSEGADYVFHGPVLDTPSKHELVGPVGFDGLAAAVGSAGRPVWALGGLAPEHASAVRACGAAGLALLRGILGAEDPGAAAGAAIRGWAGGAA